MAVQNITVTAGESATITFLKNTAAADDQMVFVISYLGIPLVIKRREIAINANTSYVVSLLPSETAALPTGAIHSLQKVGDVESVLFTGSVTVASPTVATTQLENVAPILFQDFEFTEDSEFSINEPNNIMVLGVAVKSDEDSTVTIESSGGVLFDESVSANATTKRWYPSTTQSELGVFVQPVDLQPSDFPVTVASTTWGTVNVRIYYMREPNF